MEEEDEEDEEEEDEDEDEGSAPAAAAAAAAAAIAVPRLSIMSSPRHILLVPSGYGCGLSLCSVAVSSGSVAVTRMKAP